MPVLATVGTYVSSLLHQVVFGFPSPSNETVSSTAGDHVAAAAATALGGVQEVYDIDAARKELVDMMEPGEARALMAGIGPPSFFGSGYGIVLVFMALLLNRIHATLHRPRVPAQPLPHPPATNLYWKARRKVAAIMTSPAAPRYLRVPGIICLGRAWLLFSILTLQTAQIWPAPGTLETSRWAALLGPASRWVGGMPMKSVCWQVFVSVCVGLLCSGLANGLDRRPRRDIGNGFNLFGYSFLLHLYSSPLTHNHPPPAANFGRPDLATLIQLWLSLTELTWLQITEFSEATRGQQLIPTTVIGSLGLIHFVYVLMFAPRFFPSFTFLTHLLALFLSVVIITTMMCRALSFLFTYGYVPSPVLASLIPKSESLPSLYDDFGMTLLKLGVACMETTQWSGLKNELVGVETKAGPYVQLTAASSELGRRGGSAVVEHEGAGAKGGFATEITDIDVAKREEPDAGNDYGRLHRRFLFAIWFNLIGLALWGLFLCPGGRKLYDGAIRLYNRRWWYGPRQWRFWRQQAWATPAHFAQPAARRQRLIEGQRRAAAGFYQAAANAGGVGGGRTWDVDNPDMLGRARQVVDAVEDTLRQNQKQRHSSGRQSRMASPNVFEVDEQDVLSVPYHQYLRGEVEMEDDEDEGDEWVPGDGNEDGWATESEADAEQASADEDDEDDVLLAHVNYTSASPLTRRQYAALRQSPSSSSTPRPASSTLRYRSNASPTPQPSTSTSLTVNPHTLHAAQVQEPSLQIVAMQRRIAALEADKGRDEWDDDRRKCCVVCTVEARDTIFWPCRCLAVCNECRENLAERLSAKDHMCPCCRKK